MLVLTRWVGETIVIGDNIKVSVLASNGNQIRIGIEAPREVSVHREEIYQRIQEQGDRSKMHDEAPHGGGASE